MSFEHRESVILCCCGWVSTLRYIHVQCTCIYKARQAVSPKQSVIFHEKTLSFPEFPRVVFEPILGRCGFKGHMFNLAHKKGEPEDEARDIAEYLSLL